MAVVLFIKTEDLKKNTIVSGSVDVDKFIHYIKIAQQLHIERILGTKLKERLQAGIVANDLNANEQILLNEWVQDPLIHHAMAEYLPWAAYQVKNGGVFKHTSETSANADKSEVDFLVQKERNLAQFYTDRLIDYLCNNSTLYPEYRTNVDEDIRPTKTVNHSGGWFLDDTPSSEDLRQIRDLET